MVASFVSKAADAYLWLGGVDFERGRRLSKRCSSIAGALEECVGLRAGGEAI
jgi:hypothetical protein